MDGAYKSPSIFLLNLISIRRRCIHRMHLNSKYILLQDIMKQHSTYFLLLFSSTFPSPPFPIFINKEYNFSINNLYNSPAILITICFKCLLPLILYTLMQTLYRHFAPEQLQNAPEQQIQPSPRYNETMFHCFFLFLFFIIIATSQ